MKTIDPIVQNKSFYIDAPPNKRLLIFDLDETLLHCYDESNWKSKVYQTRFDSLPVLITTECGE